MDEGCKTIFLINNIVTGGAGVVVDEGVGAVVVGGDGGAGNPKVFTITVIFISITNRSHWPHQYT